MTETDGTTKGGLREFRKLLSAAKQSAAARLNVPGYTEIEPVARGAQGLVYSAVRELDRERVALKVLIPEAPPGSSAWKRFMQQFTVNDELGHPGVLKILTECRAEDGRPCLVLPWLERGTLADQTLGIGSELFPSLGDFEQFAEELTAAIAHAHERGVLHRDLKPSNILLTDAGCPLLSDFGLAARVTPEGDRRGSQISSGGGLIGDLHYAAPEQFQSEPTLSTRSDLYSLGGVLYHCFSGSPPFPADSDWGRTLLAKQAAPVRASQQRHALSALHARMKNTRVRAWDAIFSKLLQPNPALRYASADALLLDIRAVRAGRPIRSDHRSIWKLTSNWLAAHPAISGLIAVSGILLVGLAYQTLARAEENSDALRDFIALHRASFDDFGAVQDPSLEEERVRTTLSLHAQLAKRYPDDPWLRREFARASSRLGELLRDRGEAVAALPHLRSSVELWRRHFALTDIAPEGAAFANTLQQLGACYLELRQNQLAIEALEASLELALSLVQQEPLRADHLERASWSHYRLALALYRKDASFEAKKSANEHCESAIRAIARAEGRGYPASRAMMMQIRVILAQAEAARIDGRPQLNHDLVLKAHEIAVEAAARYPENRYVQLELASSHARHMNVLLSSDQESEAALKRDLARSLAAELLEIETYRNQAQVLLAEIAAQWIGRGWDSPPRATLCEIDELAQEYLRLLKKSPESTRLRRRYAGLLHARADLLRREGRELESAATLLRLANECGSDSSLVETAVMTEAALRFLRAGA